MCEKSGKRVEKRWNTEECGKNEKGCEKEKRVKKGEKYEKGEN